MPDFVAIEGRRAGPLREGAWQFLAAKLPAGDLTAAALEGVIPEAVGWPARSAPAAAHADPFDRLARALYRRTHNHVLITGRKGVGKTTLVRELARRSAVGRIDFLTNRRFLWLDTHNVGPEESRGCFETVLMACEGRRDIVLCLDGLGALLRRPQGADNKSLLRAAAHRPGLQVIGVLDPHEYQDLIGSDAALAELFTRVELDEPSEETAIEIALRAADEMSRDFGLRVEDTIVQRAVALSSSYLLSECHPAKAIRILRRCCEEVDYERTQLGRERAAVTIRDVVRVISDVTGIPEETVSGDAENADFEGALRAVIVGQDAAVREVASELQLIKAGLTDADRPATVLLFAGMTGVGKTELAKQVAALYSTSKRLQVYTMGNFTEAHTVSGIIGVPAGYVGHEQGGRLVNELNADPYCVFLLDEAEKAHPNVWKPFLNLFDEGWIMDQRGVKAHADRAIFILTTNAGDQSIAQMFRSGKPEHEIADHVRNVLTRVRQERSSQPVFSPQFLARIKRILVFRPLDEAAMIGIARKLAGDMYRRWQRRREKEVEISDELTTLIGRRAHAQNEQSGGKEGGRIVRKLISELIENEIQRQSMLRKAEYKACRRIEMRSTMKADATGDLEVEIQFFPAAS